MAFEAFQRKQRVLNELMGALHKIEEILPELTVVEMEELSSGIDALISAEQAQRRNVLAHNTWSGTKSATDLPAPTQAVEALLAQAPESGLSASEIVAALEGKIKTSSDKPRDVIYSAIAHLKKEGRITQLANKNYVPREDDGDEEEGDNDKNEIVF